MSAIGLIARNGILALAGAKVFYNGAFLGVTTDVPVIPEEQAQRDMAREFRQSTPIDRETMHKRRWLAEELRK